MAREVGIGVRHAACWNRGEDSIDCATGANRLYSVPNFAKRRGGRITRLFVANDRELL